MNEYLDVQGKPIQKGFYYINKNLETICFIQKNQSRDPFDIGRGKYETNHPNGDSLILNLEDAKQYEKVPDELIKRFMRFFLQKP